MTTDAPRRPTLSVLLCNYNYAGCVGNAIEAMLGQSRPPDDLVIVEDGSTDDSAAVIERYARENPKVIRFVRNPRNLGLGASLGRGLSMITADWVYCAASDDVVKPGFFEKAMAMAERHPEVGIVFGRMLVSVADGPEHMQDELPEWREPQLVTPRRFLDEYLRRAPGLHSLTSATIWRREPFLEFGGMQLDLGHYVDTFTARAMAMKYGACFIPHPCVLVRFSPGGLSGSQMRDLSRGLAPIEKSVALMRAPPYSDLFPRDFTDWWERDARKRVIYAHCSHKYVVPDEERRRARPPRSVLGAVRDRVSWFTARVKNRIARRVLRLRYGC